MVIEDIIKVDSQIKKFPKTVIAILIKKLNIIQHCLKIKLYLINVAFQGNDKNNNDY